jgi:hypothetical protein
MTYASQMKSIGIFVIIIFFFQLYNVRHLPVIDFRPYKVGNSIPELMKMPENAAREKSIYYYPMKNLKTGEITKITSDDYLNDTIWQNTSNFELVADKIEGPIVIEKGYLPPIHDFTIEPLEHFTDENFTYDGDIAPQILADTRYILLCVAYDLEHVNEKALTKTEELYKDLVQWDIPLFLMTGTSADEALSLKHKLNLSFPFTNTDPITLKTIVRANPGFVLLKEGKIIGKWHYNDLPDNKYFEQYKNK